MDKSKLSALGDDLWAWTGRSYNTGEAGATRSDVYRLKEVGKGRQVRWTLIMAQAIAYALIQPIY